MKWNPKYCLIPDYCKDFYLINNKNLIWSWIFLKKHQQPWLKKLVFTSEWCLLFKSYFLSIKNPQMERNESSWRDGWRLFLLVCAKNMRESNEESYLPSKRVGYTGLVIFHIVFFVKYVYFRRSLWKWSSPPFSNLLFT